MYGVPDSQAATENLSSGRTYVSVCSSRGATHREYNFAGSGLPDRMRSALYTLNLLRLTAMRLE